MGSIWSVQFRVADKDRECLIFKEYGMPEIRNIVKILKPLIKSRGIKPVSTWILEFALHIFETTYKAQGYTLLSISICNKRKSNGATS